jgi:cathepsin X
MSDRIKIMRKAAFPEINISPQVLVSCEHYDQGCEGGDAKMAYQWIHENNITDESCSSYQARGHTNMLGCSSQIKCKNCSPGKGCWAQEKAKIFGINEFGEVKGEVDMMNEIFQRGPITCAMAITDQFLNYTGGIFVDTTGRVEEDHDISIVGWGVENGVKYWLGRNSWGSYWGMVEILKSRRKGVLPNRQRNEQFRNRKRLFMGCSKGHLDKRREKSNQTS